MKIFFSGLFFSFGLRGFDNFGILILKFFKIPVIKLFAPLKRGFRRRRFEPDTPLICAFPVHRPMGQKFGDDFVC